MHHSRKSTTKQHAYQTGHCSSRAVPLDRLPLNEQVDCLQLVGLQLVGLLEVHFSQRVQTRKNTTSHTTTTVSLEVHRIVGPTSTEHLFVCSFARSLVGLPFTCRSPVHSSVSRSLVSSSVLFSRSLDRALRSLPHRDDTKCFKRGTVPVCQSLILFDPMANFDSSIAATTTSPFHSSTALLVL